MMPEARIRHPDRSLWRRNSQKISFSKSARALARAIPISHRARWAAGTPPVLVREDFTRFEHLMSPPATCASTAFPSERQTRFFAVGSWLAMHGDLADLNRTPCTSNRARGRSARPTTIRRPERFRHQHRRERLAIESGYFDDYGAPYNSDHWQYCGQAHSPRTPSPSMAVKGSMPTSTPGRTSTRSFDMARSLSNKALPVTTSSPATRRTPTTVRSPGRAVAGVPAPRAILVYDNVASSTARTWEWNIHALNPFDVISTAAASGSPGVRSRCALTCLPGRGAFTQSERGLPMRRPPGRSKTTYVRQHADLDAAEFIALMRVNVACDDTAATPNRTDESGPCRWATGPSRSRRTAASPSARPTPARRR